MKFGSAAYLCFGLSLAFCASLPAAAQVPGCAAPPAGLVSWYRAEINGNDSGPAGNTATAVGSVGYAPASVGTGFSLNGANGNYMQAPDVPAIDLTGGITLMAWIRPNALGGRVVDKITAGGGDGWLLDTNGGVVRLIAGTRSASGATPLPTGASSLVAGTYDGTARVYLNGALEATGTSGGAIPTNALTLKIGAASDGSHVFNGLIDEVAIFNRALSQAEIQSIYNAGAAGMCAAASANPVPAASPPLLVLIALMLGAAGSVLLRRRNL